MLFSSITFLYFFLPVVVLLYFLAPKALKNTVLLLASLVFYAWGEKMLALLFAGSIVISWLMGLLIEKAHSKGMKRFWMLSLVILELGLLGYFKYVDFFIETINSFGMSLPLLKVALPIGISFYTFQILSYGVDVYRGQVPAQKNLIDYGTYVALFPQLIAGPILRYRDVYTQLRDRTHSIDMAAEGIRRFIFGLSKKVLIANTLGQICVLFRETTDPSVLYYWMYAVCFTLQIYFDFSGYSDMAIGLGRIFGFRFMENFDHPFVSSSVTEFWRRWHISLGTWFRDYVYIPLGGNRKGIPRQVFNIALVWVLTGFWHGASWNFVLWGAFYAVFLIMEKLFLGKWLGKCKPIGHIYLIFVTIIGFTLFNADSLTGAISDIQGLFAFGSLPLVSAESLYYLISFAVIMVIAIIGSTPLPKLLVSKMKSSAGKEINFVEPIILAILLLVVTAYLVDGSFNPFLYFRF